MLPVKVEYVNAHYDIEINGYIIQKLIKIIQSLVLKYILKNDLVDDAIQNNDQVILFKNNGESLSSFRLFENIYEVWGEYVFEYSFSYADWSKDDPKLYAIRTGVDPIFYYLKLDTLETEFNLNQAKLRDSDDDDDPGIKSMGDDGWGDFDYEPKSFYQHKILYDEEQEFELNYVLFRESSESKFLLITKHRR